MQLIAPNRATSVIIIHEVVANCLIHREFTSPYPARIVIDGQALRTENASKAMFQGPITPNGFSPLPIRRSKLIRRLA